MLTQYRCRSFSMILFVICGFIFTGPKILAQPLNYTFTALSGTYTANTPLPADIIACCNMDAFASAPIPLPFSFKFACTTYNQVVITENGWFTFDPNCWDFHNVNDLSNQIGSAPGIDRPIVAPLWDDLAGDFAGGNINHQTLGLTPNRIFVIEWKQMLWNANGVTWAISFQCRLYETINRIEFVYQRNGTATQFLSTIPPLPSASIGLAGLTIGNYYSLNGTGASPSAVTSPEFDLLNTKPATNQVYRWDPICPLPISLKDFFGNNKDGRNKLEWITASEENNDYFTLERSFNGYEFTEFSIVEGAGNSNIPLHYEIYDPLISDKLVYYRLKQTDYNGQFTYSDLISVYPSGSLAPISVYPNPVKDLITIHGLTQATSYHISDITGKIIMEGSIHPEDPFINTSMITNGIYYLNFDGTNFQKLLIEK